MNFLLETIQVLLLSIWYNVESFIHLFIPIKKKNIAGEVVLISGSGSGIGRLMAQEFAALGTVLVLWDINQEGMKETARLAKQSGASRVHYYLCDCSDKNEVYRVADQVKREVGDVSILVNNAGIVTGKKFMDAPDSLIEKTVEVNTMAHFWTYKAFLPAMIANNHGHLVSIASSAGLIGVNGLADYCASKFAAVGFAESVGLELVATGKDGVKTTIVCPYFINTGMFDGCQTKSSPPAPASPAVLPWQYHFLSPKPFNSKHSLSMCPLHTINSPKCCGYVLQAPVTVHLPLPVYQY
ncbi:epidermal retinol dehydrogenase 2 isoform X3 [Sparus aurata]|uniref:Short chain dehydrogenase/reductase family 16C, member 5a n=1 Tax=Sparus aurata TaxID=8175 RepID=A0A671UFR0_SPAAU|nr:epidermal retinol dehydrogenase 2 isoform X3 [Sparus aurata]